jgi:hypothetical protein
MRMREVRKKMGQEESRQRNERGKRGKKKEIEKTGVDV